VKRRCHLENAERGGRLSNPPNSKRGKEEKKGQGIPANEEKETLLEEKGRGDSRVPLFPK